MSSSVSKQNKHFTPQTIKDPNTHLANSDFQPPPSDREKGPLFEYSLNKPNPIKIWTFFGVYIAIITVLLVFFFYFLFGFSVDQQRIYAVLNSVSKIMKDPPIADLYISNKKCPLDYESISLGEWPGIEHGCYYTDENIVKQGNCNQEKKGLGVQSIPKQGLFSWEGNTFCVRRYHYMAIEYVDDCPYGFRRCGTYLCIPEQEKCPVTSIRWVKETPPTDSKDEIILVDHEKNYYILVERTESRQPLVGFTIAYNGMPCLDTNSMPFAEATYPLLNVKSGCHYGQNFEAMIIDSITEDKFLPELSSYNVIKDLPLLSDYASKTTVYMVGLNRFKVRPEANCSNPEKFFIMGKVKSEADDITKIRSLFIITVLFGVIIIIFLSCDQRKVSLGLASIDLSMGGKNGLFVFELCILLFLLTGCCLLIVGPKVNLIKSYRDSLAVYSKSNCFMNSFITTALTDFSNGPPYEAELFYYLILVIGGLSIIPVLIVIIEKCKKRSDDKQILLKHPDHQELS